MSLETKQILEFGRFRLDVEERTLERLDGTKNGTLPGKTFETLVLLVSRPGHLVTKEELLSGIWPNTFVEENNLDKRIHHLRKYLGEMPEGGSYIETVRGCGYRFVGNVRAVQVSGSWLPEIYRPHGEIEAQPSTDVAAEPDRNTNGTYPTNNSNGSEPITHGVSSRRRAGLKRGLKILALGLGVGFVFLVLLQALLIAGRLLFQFGNTVKTGNPNSTGAMVVDLITILTVPVGVGWFLGIGLFLFGIFRMIYALFEKEGSKIRSLTVERIIAGVVCLLLLSVAVPNLLYSYRESSRVQQLNKALTEKSFAILPLKPAGASDRDEVYEFGVAESVNEKMNSVSGFKSRSLSNLRKYAELETDGLAAGRDLNVDYVLASEYQIADGQITVTSRLLNIATGAVEDTFVVVADSSNPVAAQEKIADFLADGVLARFGA